MEIFHFSLISDFQSRVESNFAFALICFIMPRDWFKILLQLSHPIRSQIKTNLWVTHTRFPALGAGHMPLLRVLIGPLSCLRSIWFVAWKPRYPRNNNGVHEPVAQINMITSSASREMTFIFCDPYPHYNPHIVL